MLRSIVLWFGMFSGSLLAQNTIEKDSIKTERYHLTFERYVHVQPAIAKNYLDSLKNISITSSYKRVPFLYTKDLAYYQFATHKMDSSLLNYEKALTMAEKNGWDKEALSCKTWLANHAYFKNNEETAEALYTEILTQASKRGYIDEASSALFGLASLERDDELALQYLLQIDSLHRTQNIVTANLANAYGAIGGMYLKSFGNRELARSYYEKSFEAAQESNYAAGINDMTVILGKMALEEGNHDEAYRLFQLDLERNRSKNDTNNLRHSLIALASVDMALQKFNAAKLKLEDALVFHKQLEDSVSITETHMTLARVHLELGNASEANSHIEYARNFPHTLSMQDYQIDLQELTVNYLELQGKYKEAFEEQKKLEALKEKRIEERNSDAFLEMEQKYRADQKEQEIELLKSEQELANARSKNQRIALITGLVLASLIGLFFYFQYRQRQRTNEKLQQLDRAKTTFFQNISHEFRTPLTLIKGPLEKQLEVSGITPTDRQWLQTAQRNTVRLENLVEQLMALSKLESGYWRLQVRPGDLKGFIYVQADAFKHMALEKNLEFKMEIAPLSDQAWFDPDALEKILFNLLGNAMKFTPEEGTIWLQGGKEGNFYELQVKNTGSYIAPEDRAVLFDRFFQTQHNKPGTGIGLSLTKELVELHHGNIQVESDEKTTNFRVKLPIDRSAYKESELLPEELQTVFTSYNQMEQEPSQSLAIPPEDAPLLLVIDDNKEIVSYIASVFSESFRVETAHDGMEGFERALEHVPDIVISDVMMPKEDGFELTHKLKEAELTCHIPILLLTAKAEEKDRLTGLTKGADAYLSKPFSTQVLKATVANLLDNRRKLQDRYAQEIILTPKKMAVSNADERFLQRLQQVLDEHMTSPSFSTSKFSETMSISRMQLHRKLKALTGLSTTEFLRSQRVKLAARLLKEENLSIAEAGYSVGFNDPSYFAKCFKNEFGCSPSEYIK